MNKRYAELDALRGLAAITVVLTHYLSIYPWFNEVTFGVEKYTEWNLIKYSPISILWAGHEAVVLFFILSGFVLSLPYYANKNSGYLDYLVKRVCRIYIPYIFSVLLAIVCALLFSQGGISSFSNWFNERWSLPINWNDIYNHLFLINDFNNSEFNPIYWSLVHEMRISIIFPLIILVILRFNWKLVLLGSVAFSTFGFMIENLMSTKSDMVSTIKYFFMFVVGAILAKNRIILQNKYFILSLLTKNLMLVLGLFLYTFQWWGYYVPVIHNNLTVDLFITLGASIFIITAISSRRISKVLLIRPFQYLGRISFSLYLYHCIALFSLIYLLHNKINIIFILLISLVLTFIISSLAYIYIEKPSSEVGKKIVEKRQEIAHRLKKFAK